MYYIENVCFLLFLCGIGNFIFLFLFFNSFICRINYPATCSQVEKWFSFHYAFICRFLPNSNTQCLFSLPFFVSVELRLQKQFFLDSSVLFFVCSIHHIRIHLIYRFACVSLSQLKHLLQTFFFSFLLSFRCLYTIHRTIKCYSQLY